jgi:hypothetical protein
LPHSIRVRDFVIGPSIEVDLIPSTPRSGYRAYITPVVMPEGMWQGTTHALTTALAAIFSFVFGRPCKAIEHREWTSSLPEQLSLDQKIAIGLNYPVRIMGYFRRQPIELSLVPAMAEELADLVSLLDRLSDDDYAVVMRAMRGFQHALNNYETDYGLAYYLLVSSIEIAAQKAESTQPDKLTKDIWMPVFEVSSEFNDAYVYWNSTLNVRSATKKFNNFLDHFCPIEIWENFGLDFLNEKINERMLLRPEAIDEEWHLRNTIRFTLSDHPKSLTQKQKKRLIEDTYKYRSKYVHEGQTPSGKDIDGERFFKRITIYNQSKNEYEETLIMGYPLLSFIAKNAITNFLRDGLIHTNRNVKWNKPEE